MLKAKDYEEGMAVSVNGEDGVIIDLLSSQMYVRLSGGCFIWVLYNDPTAKVKPL